RERGVQLLRARFGLAGLADAAQDHLLQHERDHRHHEADHPPLDPAQDALRPAPFDGHADPRRDWPTATNTIPHASASHAHTGSNAPPHPESSSEARPSPAPVTPTIHTAIRRPGRRSAAASAASGSDNAYDAIPL